MRPEKLFVLTRRDMIPGQQVVQSCHSVAGLTMAYGGKPQYSINEWNDIHQTMIVLGVENKHKLYEWKYKLECGDIIHYMFMEPDQEYDGTSIAVMPGVDPDFFNGLELL